jgi:hypothetical protein
MIERHENHDEAAQPVDFRQPMLVVKRVLRFAYPSLARPGNSSSSQ